jgi:putative transposase
MFLQPYQPHELHFAFCYRIYFRCRTHALNSIPALARLDRKTLNSLVRPYDLRVLQVSSDARDLLVVLSLRPTETIAAAAGKLKGRVSKWLSETQMLRQPTKLLSQGYFACTIGKARRCAVEHYLTAQSQHHGYDSRPIPPIFVEHYEFAAADRARVSPKHAFVVADFHIVLSTRFRKGVFGTQPSRQVCDAWLKLQVTMPVFIRKVSFVPDHVHIALRLHPSVAPADVVVALMNSAQEVMINEMIRTGIDRLWQSSAYIGSYGDLASPQVRKYIDNWKRNR